MRFLTNLLYRSKDPTRLWQPEPSRVSVDLTACALCGVPLGAAFDRLTALGPTEDAKRATKGALDWNSRGLSAFIEDGRLADFTVRLESISPSFGAYAGPITAQGKPLSISDRTTIEDLTAILGEPFGRTKEDWEYEIILFFEFPAGELQAVFSTNGTLESFDFWYEPELAQTDACETYGIPKKLPQHFHRKLPLSSSIATFQQQSQQQQ